MTIEALDEFAKGGPYYGPRGGKWKDPQHKIPWDDKEPKGGGKKAAVDKSVKASILGMLSEHRAIDLTRLSVSDAAKKAIKEALPALKAEGLIEDAKIQTMSGSIPGFKLTPKGAKASQGLDKEVKEEKKQADPRQLGLDFTIPAKKPEPKQEPQTKAEKAKANKEAKLRTAISTEDGLKEVFAKFALKRGNQSFYADDLPKLIGVAKEDSAGLVQKLEDKGLITSKKFQIGPKGSAPTKLYQVADKGREAREDYFTGKTSKRKDKEAPQKRTSVQNYAMGSLLDRDNMSVNALVNASGKSEAEIKEAMGGLVKQGLVKETQVSTGGKYKDPGYAITDKGKSQLKAEREKTYKKMETGQKPAAKKQEASEKPVSPEPKVSTPTYSELRAGKLLGKDPATGNEFKRVGDTVWSVSSHGITNRGSYADFEKQVKEGKYHSRIKFTGLDEGEKKKQVLESPQYDVDFSEGFKAGKAAHDKDPYTDASHAKAAYEKVSGKHGSYYEDGFKAAIDHKRGLYAGDNLKIARHLGLVPPPTLDWKPEDEPLNIQKSIDTLDDFAKGGPYYGPRGGKWADPQHKIPWQESKKKPSKKKPTEKKPEKETSLRHWVSTVDVGLPAQTINKYKGPNGYTPERKRLHSAIISKFVDHVPSVPSDQRPVAIVMMGGGGAGKGTIVRHVMGDEHDFVNVNSDDCKEELPEYQQALDLGKKDGKTISARDAAWMAHEESSDIAKDILQIAIADRKNLIMDGTGSNSDKYQGKIQKLKDAGYHVRVMMPHISLDEAKRRADMRAERSGRYVPHEILEQAHHLIPGNFEKIARTADEFALFDNSGRPPRPVWSFNGEKETVLDPKFVNDFKKLGKERHAVARAKGWMKSLQEWLEMRKAEGMKVSLSMEDMLKRMETKRDEVLDTASMLDDFAPEMEKHLEDMAKKSMGENEMNGIDALDEFAKGNGAMPSGEPKLGGNGEEQGGKLAGVGKTGGSGDSASGPPIAAPNPTKDKLSEDDAEDEKAMKEHKKPIEKTAKASKSFRDTTPQGIRDAYALEHAQYVSKLKKGEPDERVGIPGVPRQQPEPEPMAKSREWGYDRESRVVYSTGTDEFTAKMAKSDSFYHGVSAPRLSPHIGIMHIVRCKACGDKMSKALTACPHCGEGTAERGVVYVDEGRYVDDK